MTFTSCFAHLRKAPERTMSRPRRRIRSFARNLTAREAANYFRHAGPPRAPTGKSATACDLARHLVGGCLGDFAGWSGCPSIAALTIDPEIDVMGHERLSSLPLTRQSMCCRLRHCAVAALLHHDQLVPHAFCMQ
jgi:hypothetical protein